MQLELLSIHLGCNAVQVGKKFLMRKATGAATQKATTALDITEELEHWSLYWYHVEGMEIAELFSGGEINDAELLS